MIWTRLSVTDVQLEQRLHGWQVAVHQENSHRVYDSYEWADAARVVVLGQMSVEYLTVPETPPTRKLLVL